MTPQTRARLAILAVMILAGALGLVAAGRPAETAPLASPPAEREPVPPAAPRSALDERIEAQTRFAETSRSWVDWDVVASLLLDRAAAGGGLDDLARASEALDRAFALSEPGSGPHLRRAVLAARLHRLDECEAMLDAVDGYALATRADRLSARALRADVAFFRGQYADARRGYESLAAEQLDAQSLFALARLEWSTGHPDRAAAHLDRAEVVAVGALEPFLAVARAHLLRESGDLSGAATATERALRLRPDDVESQLLLAELRLEQGELDAARSLVRRALARGDGPRVHEIAARLARARGDQVAAEEHRAAATRAYEALYERFPEAIAGHATLHFLRFEDESRAVEMAETDATARPFGEARARLALAYLRTGRTVDARREVEVVLATEWRTAELHAIAAEILAASGAPEAAEQRALAEARAPGVTERVAGLRAP